MTPPARCTTPRSVRHHSLGAFLALCGLVTACSPGDPAYNDRVQAFGAHIDVSILGVHRATAEWAVSQLAQDFAFMDQAWDAWGSGPLARTNLLLATGKDFSAPPSVLPLITRAAKLAAESDDLFNPATGRLTAAWGFQSTGPHCIDPPSADTLARLVQSHPRMSDISVHGMQVRTTNPAVELDFSGLITGYGIDKAIEHLKDMGIHDALVNAGGNVRAIGSRDGKPWRVAIRRPDGTGVYATIDLMGDESVFSAGDAERSDGCDGNSYLHIIDPRTGYPATGTRAVTVVDTSAATADAAARALFVAGPQRWAEIAERMGIKCALLIDSHDVLHITPAMEDRLSFVAPVQDVRVNAPSASPGNARR